MAIIVPFLVSAGATAMGVTAATATLISTVTSVVFQVTGINNKINKAASKVFGEDLVQIANIAGAVYGAVNGGFNLGSGDAAAGATLGKATLDGTNAFGANSAAGAYDLAGAAEATAGLAGSGANVAGETLSKSVLDGTDAFGSNSVGDSFNLAEQAGMAPDAGTGTNLLDPQKPLGVDAKSMEEATKMAEQSQGGAASTNAAASDATAGKASAGQQLGAGNTTQPIQSPVTPPVVKPPTTPSLGAKAGSFFDKLLSNDKATGELIKGIGGGISSAATNKAQKDELDRRWRMKTSLPTVQIRQ